MFRQLICHVLKSMEVFDTIREFGEAEPAVAQLLFEVPSLVIIDLVLPGIGGLDFLEHIKTQGLQSKALIVSGMVDRPMIKEVFSHGADGFILKTESIYTFQSGVQQVLNGHTFFCQSSSALLRQHLQNRDNQIVENLTRQERRVLQLYARGRTAKEIASELNIADGTASNHLTKIKQKLNAQDPATLLRYAAEHGLGPPAF